MAEPFADVKVGDIVTRMLAGSIPMQLKVTAISKEFIYCGPWVFNRANGGEVDLELEWDGVKTTGSYLVKGAPTMFGPSLGTWRVHSDLDPRWNKTGRGVGFVTEGGPQEMKDWIKHCREEYGEPPPDCEESFHKD